MSRQGFPIWWDTTVTVYNKYEDAQTNVVTWYRNVVSDCFWQLTGNEIKIGDTNLNSKAIVCRIPKDSKFLEKQDWVKLPNDEMGNFFTLSPGDIIVKGECDFEINEYIKGHRSTDLLAQYHDYQACMEITKFSNNTGIGRNNEHYFTQGM